MLTYRFLAGVNWQKFIVFSRICIWSKWGRMNHRPCKNSPPGKNSLWMSWVSTTSNSIVRLRLVLQGQWISSDGLFQVQTKWVILKSQQIWAYEHLIGHRWMFGCMWETISYLLRSGLDTRNEIEKKLLICFSHAFSPLAVPTIGSLVF